MGLWEWGGGWVGEGEERCVNVREREGEGTGEKPTYLGPLSRGVESIERQLSK